MVLGGPGAARALMHVSLWPVMAWVSALHWAFHGGWSAEHRRGSPRLGPQRVGARVPFPSTILSVSTGLAMRPEPLCHIPCGCHVVTANVSLLLSACLPSQVLPRVSRGPWGLRTYRWHHPSILC